MNEESNLLIDNFVTNIEKNNNMLVVTEDDEGVITTSYIDLNREVNTTRKEFKNVNTGSPYTGNVQYSYINHRYYTTWLNDGSWTGSSQVARFTLTVVIGILSGMSGNGFVIGGVGAAAQFIVDNRIPEVYWSSTQESLWEITYPGKLFIGSPVGIKTYTKFYSDSKRTNYIGDGTNVYHDPEYWPEGMNW